MKKRGKRHGRRWLAAGAAGLLALALGLAAEPWRGRGAGCRQEDLTNTPDAAFATGALEASAEEGEARKLVCLTFDDGPSETTPAILDALREAQVPATFFVISADNNRDYLPLVRREVEEGHQVALHSCTHEYKKIYTDPDSYWQDIKALRQALAEFVDVDSIHCLRFPGGSTNTVSYRYGGSSIMKRLKAQAEERGYHYIDWNVCADDAVGGHPSADEVFENTIRDVGDKRTCVVLMHDTAATKTTAQALPRIIAWFQEQGFAFCTVNELLEQES